MAGQIVGYAHVSTIEQKKDFMDIYRSVTGKTRGIGASAKLSWRF